MIAKIFSIIAFLLGITANGQAYLHDEVRIMFCSGWEGMCGAKELADKLKGKDLSNNMVLLAYRGAAVSTLANCESAPWKKFKYFNSGKNEIESAVQGDPMNWEIRFIRFTVQSHIPEFLNYNNLEEDKGIVMEALHVNLQQEEPEDFNFTVSAIMMKSAFLNEMEKKQLQKLLAKT